MHIPMRIHVPKNVQKEIVKGGIAYLVVCNVLLGAQVKDLKKAVKTTVSGYEVLKRGLIKAVDDMTTEQLEKLGNDLDNEVEFQKIINPAFKPKA